VRGVHHPDVSIARSIPYNWNKGSYKKSALVKSFYIPSRVIVPSQTSPKSSSVRWYKHRPLFPRRDQETQWEPNNYKQHAKLADGAGPHFESSEIVQSATARRSPNHNMQHVAGLVTSLDRTVGGSYPPVIYNAVWQRGGQLHWGTTDWSVHGPVWGSGQFREDDTGDPCSEHLSG
jgi:hypothetical protein